MRTTIAHQLNKLYDLTAAVSATAPIGSPTGYTGMMPVPAGTRVCLGGNEIDELLFFVNTLTGALVSSGQNVELYTPAANEEAIELEADTGDMEWIMVKNETGATIERGTPVLIANDGTYSVVVSAAGTDSNSRVCGIAQFDIPDDKAAYVLCKGKGVVLASGAGLALGLGAGFKLDSAGGGGVIDAGVAELALGHKIENAAVAAGSLSEAYVDIK